MYSKENLIRIFYCKQADKSDIVISKVPTKISRNNKAIKITVNVDVNINKFYKFE